MSGKSSTFLSFNGSSTENIWIIDFSTTDHMTPYSSYFSSYTALFGHYRHTLLIFSEDVNLSHPLKYGFNTYVLVILHLVPSSPYFLFYLQKCLLSHFIAMFVSLLNTIEQLFFPMLIKVLNVLILFIHMYEDLHLFLISLVKMVCFIY